MIYIQEDIITGLPHHFDAACAMYGAIDLGLKYRLTTFEEVKSGKFDSVIAKNLFVGSVEFMKEVFGRLGISDVRVPVNSNRTSELITLTEAKKRAENGERLFIKPAEIKLFTGFVLDGMEYSCLKDLPGDTKLIAYEPFKWGILSEWRVYVRDGVIIDSRNYSGDFKVSPNYNIVEQVIRNQTSGFPCAYTIDVGVLESGNQVVVEFNDMWAIGNYGIPNDIYLKALKARYDEIFDNYKQGLLKKYL